MLEAAWKSKRWNSQELSRCFTFHLNLIEAKLQENRLVRETGGKMAAEEKNGEQVGNVFHNFHSNALGQRF